MLTKEKLSTHLKDLFIERIGDVEASFTKPQPFTVRPMAQAPSTQRILDGMDHEQQTPNMPPPAKRIVGGEVDTGKGTRGPRKY